MTGAILVTGGAGYPGSHTTRQLVRAGYRLTVRDNMKGNGTAVVSCGYGRGFSGRDAVGPMQRVRVVQFPVGDGPRRAGDPAALVADNRQVRGSLSCSPRHDDPGTTCRTAWAWELEPGQDTGRGG